ncbi:SDR family NAD(P)-dependent oxidoreductase [Lutimaribacter marinistellae]|uniref:SDR family NAD(P)-dependent oxidoreductase n=1 Tax=Lutimaribacter marinistellae TaxID=1820329 RepID=A0ABV7TML7_9RHOB
MRVLITGANRGIGKALADRYRQAGHDVIATARDKSADAVLDVTDPDQHRHLADALSGQAIDLLVCNAGVYLDKAQTIEGYTPQVWADTFAVNVTGVFLTVQSLLPNVRAAGGKIAIISSQMGSDTRAPGGSYVYRASKAAALNFGRNLASDLAGEGIAVGIYHPGWVRTDMGGQTAEIAEGEAAAGLIERFAALSLDTTGCFETWDGRPHPF